MTETTLFKSNKTQAVRLPMDVAFPDSVSRVAILREGKRRILVPVELGWDDFFAAPGIATGDRDQPEAQKRGAL
jgi:antitoxin VapB